MDKAKQSGKPKRRRKVKNEEVKEEDKAAPVESVEEALPEATVEEFRAVEPPPSEDEEKPYSLGTWRGRMQWKCKQCPWDTLEGEAAMLEHIASAHTPPPKRKGIVLIADKSGRQIN